VDDVKRLADQLLVKILRMGAAQVLDLRTLDPAECLLETLGFDTGTS
jgi:hypothetical protein